MRKFIFIVMFLTSSFVVCSQDFEDMTFGTDSTFEVVSWNIETFPKNGSTTLDFVSTIIDSLDVDLFAIQEVSDTNQFKQMINDLDSYVGYFQSSWFAGLAYIYNPEVIQINDIYEIYTSSSYWDEFPRSPMVMDLTYNDERIIVINNHLKCCGDEVLNLSDNDDEETRRYHACILLKSYIEVVFLDEKVIVLGDLNDELSDDLDNNVFQPFIDDPDNFMFVDYDISFGNPADWSYPSWPSDLDHILITNDLFLDFSDPASDVEVIKIDEFMSGGWYEYEENISDHRPVALKLKVTKNSDIGDNIAQDFKLINYPNPFTDKTNFYFDQSLNPTQIVVFNTLGNKVLSQKIVKGQTAFEWNTDSFPVGFYHAVLYQNRQRLSSIKLIKTE